MKPALALLAILTAGLPLAFADPPDTPANPSAAQQNASAKDGTSQNGAAQTAPSPPAAAAARTPPAPAATPAPGIPGERMAEQQLRLQGYRLTMVRGQEMYCRREAPLGSRLESTMHCVTVAEAEIMAKEGKETTERLQRNTPGCLTPAMGGCGK